MSFRHTALLSFPLLLLAGLAGYAAEVNATQPPLAPPDTETHKLEGIFNTDLPKTEDKGTMRVIVHPHFGDFLNRSYVRIPTGVRWGAGERAELSATVEPYIEHGLKHRGSGVGTGLGDVEFGGKYHWQQWPAPDLDTGVGLNVFLPVGHPPVDMTTGYDRYSPYFVVGKHPAGHPGVQIFCNAGVNLLRKSSVVGIFERNQAHSDSIAITPGFVYDHFPYHFTCEFSYETTSLIGRGHQQFYTVRPGFAWDLPPRWKFNAKGRWVVGGSFHVTFGPDGTSTGGGGKIRAEFGFKRWFSGK